MDDDVANDDTDDDLLNDDIIDDDLLDDDTGDDDTTSLQPVRYVRPDLPLNAYHIAATHNTYIWRGAQGFAALVSSLGLTQSLDKGQRFMEIDVFDVIGDGDFWVHHGGSTGRVRLSGLLRNVRWWSDTHPEHEVIVLGWQWSTDAGPLEMADLRALLAEFLEDPSPLVETGPLYDLDTWLANLIAQLDEPTRQAITALTPRELALVVGYPSIRELRGRVVLEMGGGVFEAQPAFFRMDDEGQVDNNSEATLEDLAKIAQNRMDQRLTRVYTGGGRVLSSNYDLFKSMAAGATNSALNMEWTSPATREVYAFQDENAPGFAPAGYVQTVDELPTRLGPPVFVTAFAATEEMELDLAFDAEIGLPAAPIVLFHVIVEGLSGGTMTDVDITDPAAIVLRESDTPA
ncbi:MAG: phosphatidylinositol-specific phospholipase C domain-containing protein, partial [Alphaproteobacteria bacterium]